jgi:hypothetical protein
MTTTTTTNTNTTNASFLHAQVVLLFLHAQVIKKDNKIALKERAIPSPPNAAVQMHISLVLITMWQSRSG